MADGIDFAYVLHRETRFLIRLLVEYQICPLACRLTFTGGHFYSNRCLLLPQELDYPVLYI
jgi:hypothetical protein